MPGVLDAILDRQKEAWLAGSHPSVEELLRDSTLPEDSEVLLDVIYNEIVLREELGETPALEEYIERYPRLEEELKVHFEVHRAVHDKLLVETRGAKDANSVGDFTPDTFEMGPRLSDYEIIGVLGRGGMGIVYKARQRRLKRVVALKMFQPGQVPSPRELSRFRSEAEAIARLQHPNIVQIFEVGEERGGPFLALELVENGTLAERLRDLPFAPRAAAELIQVLARAIQHAHEQRVVHRDLKPANVLFAHDGTPKITDFGLAKVLEEDLARDATRSGEPVGTPRYMSPEQATGRPDQIGPATDVYALGTILYECLTGQVPFVSASVVETVDKIRYEDPVPPRRLQRSIPRDLETICLCCLQKLPGRRYASALALADDLRRFLQGEPIQARRTPAWERAAMWCIRHPLKTAAVAAGVLLIAAGVVLGYAREQRLARSRGEIVQLVREGRDALAGEDVQLARVKFEAALSKILAEPALRDQELLVRGWLEQGLRDSEKHRWKQRTPPPVFDERRDEALVQCVLSDSRDKESVHAARQSIQDALEFAVTRGDREQLVLLDADLVLRAGDAPRALALLDEREGISSQMWHRRRAACLERLGKTPEADAERRQAEKLAPEDTLRFFLDGVDRFHLQDFSGAARDFDNVLGLEPEYFIARLFQAICFLRLQRHAEAKVALTACIAQRPQCVWSYLFRGQAHTGLGEHALAARDFCRAMELHPTGLALRTLDQALDVLVKSVASLPEEGQHAFWNERVGTDTGSRRLRDIPAFRSVADLLQGSKPTPQGLAP
jgi:tetratricopeptide (TPR) repeat protein/tRNA A-37 threonylcarbamoyl transferase component Bud32